MYETRRKADDEMKGSDHVGNNGVERKVNDRKKLKKIIEEVREM